MAFSWPILVVAGSLALSACADWPDELDATDWIDGSDAETEGPVPGADEDFPNLGSVPDPPENVSTLEEIQAVEQSLNADLENAQYTSGTYQRADDETAPLAVPAPVEVIEEEEDIEVLEDGDDLSAIDETVAVEEDVVDVTAIDEQIIDELAVTTEPAAEEVVTEDVVMARADIAADTTGQSLVAKSERDPEGSYIATTDNVEVVKETMVVVEQMPTVGELPTEEEVAVNEIDIVETATDPAEPLAQTSAGSHDGALPPQAVSRLVAAMPVLETVAVVAPAAGPPLPAQPPSSSASMSEELDSVFAASSPDAVAGGGDGVAASASANQPVVQGPSITAAGDSTLTAVVRFDPSSTVLDDQDQRVVEEIADLHDQRGGHIRLIGFASRQPGNDNETNELLRNFYAAVDRATAVADELIRLGVASQDIVVDTQGEQVMAGLTDSQSDEAQQQRVEIYLTN